MITYSEEAFDRVYHDVTDTDIPNFDFMLMLAEATLKNSVKRWCYEDSALRGGYADDVMQEILIRLIKHCVTGFFLREGKPNYDAAGFKSWMFTVAKNVKNDFAKKVRRQQFIEVKELDDNDCAATDGVLESLELTEKLSGAFTRVIESDIGIYKVLTWVAQMLIIADKNVTKIQSNDILISRFSSLTLDAMLNIIIESAKEIPWLKLSEEHICRLRFRLDEKTADGSRLGDKTYSDFFMKKGPKATVSDWVNRINNYILKEA